MRGRVKVKGNLKVKGKRELVKEGTKARERLRLWLEGNLETKSSEGELIDRTGSSSVWVNEQGFKVKLQ